MQNAKMASAQSEPQFAALVDTIAADPNRYDQLADLLREDHPFYDERGAATVVRMRGWVLLAMARSRLSEAALIFVLEELDTGTDAYLVAAAARALRSYPRPDAALAPFVLRALTNIRYRDEPVSFKNYGEYAISSTGTSPVRELLATLEWLGPHARNVLRELESVCAQSSVLSKKLRTDVDRAVRAIRGVDQADEPGTRSCCSTTPRAVRNMVPRALNSRRGPDPVELIVLQDHAGKLITFRDFFKGQPSIVVFFYTRCNNPLKCSLTVTKLGRIQRLLEAQGLADQIRTAAITYDPAFDQPERLRAYGQDRGVRMDADHRMLRVIDGNDGLCRHFELGVNFIGSLVNWHRIEAYILDAEGRIALSFERIHWDEQQILTYTVEVLKEKQSKTRTRAQRID